MTDTDDLVRWLRESGSDNELDAADRIEQQAERIAQLERERAALREQLAAAEARSKALEEAAREFVRKVEAGEARSTRSYAEFKAALALRGEG
jgi:predicted nuclease with TOPRIM domain